MATFPFELVSPEKLLFSGDVEAVKLPGSEGEFVILANHAPLLALLGPGIMEVTGGAAGTQRLFIDGGFCDMNGVACTVLAEAVVPTDQGAASRIDTLVSEGEAAAATLSGHALDEANRRLGALRAARGAVA